MKIAAQDSLRFEGSEKQAALRCVPFSSLVYLSRPWPAALSRRRTQAFFLLMAVLNMQAMIRSEKAVFPQFEVFRFTLLQTRTEPQLQSFPTDHSTEPSTFKVDSFHTLNGTLPRVSALGLLFNGKELFAPHSLYHDDRSIYLTFPYPVEWNGWYFATSCFSDPLLDPVRFALHAHDGAAWVPVGSSSYVRTHVGFTFFHAPFLTPLGRGRRVFFDLSLSFPGKQAYNVGMELGLVACGAAGREELGTSVLQASITPPCTTAHKNLLAITQ
jgi:hypothetical protein